MIRACALAVLACVAAAPLGAQTPTLAKTDSLIAAGHYDEARQTLQHWKRTYPAGTPMSDSTRARSIMLEARLTPEIAQAQELLLAIALTHPTTRHAPEALLRLGQSFAAAGDHRRARNYLDRLVSDYPRSELRPYAVVWLARSQVALGSATQACTLVRNALRQPSLSTEESQLLKIEEPAACNAQQRSVAAAAESSSTPRSTATRESGSSSQPARTTAGAAQNTRTASSSSTTPARFALQAGAFRDVQGARDLVQRLQRANYRSRIVTVPGTNLYRVRVGSWTTRDAAVRELAELRAKRFTAIIVDDAARERAVR